MSSNEIPNDANTHRATQLPDEILEAIMKSLGDSESTSSYPNFTIQPWWITCSLVCKRWRNIILPHLFRSIHLIDPEITPTSRTVRFFLETPVIASLVQALWLEETAMEDADGLDRLLNTLASLRWLRLDSVTIRGDDGSPERPLRYASHKLDTLIYQTEFSIPPFQSFVTLVNLLALFSEVGELRTNVIVDDELDDDNWPSEEDVNAFAAQALNSSTGRSSTAGPLIRQLSCQYDRVGIAGAGYLTPLYLLKLGLTRNLTHLAFTSTCDIEWSPFLDCISASCATLTGLHVEIVMFTQHGINHDVASLQPILSACNSLSDLTLITHLDISPFSTGLHPQICARHPDGEHFCYTYISHQPHWLAIMHLLQSVSPLAPLRHLKIGLRGTSTNPHILDWSQLSDWCSKRVILQALPSESSSSSMSLRPRLERVEVALEQVYDQSGCMEYEMREFVRGCPGVFLPRFDLPGEDCVASELVMRSFGLNWEIVRYECLDGECRRYRGVE